MQTHGIDRVRQALQGATGPDVMNPAGFITWYLRQPSMGSAIKAEPVEQESVNQQLPCPTHRSGTATGVGVAER